MIEPNKAIIKGYSGIECKEKEGRLRLRMRMRKCKNISIYLSIYLSACLSIYLLYFIYLYKDNSIIINIVKFQIKLLII